MPAGEELPIDGSGDDLLFGRAGEDLLDGDQGWTTPIVTEAIRTSPGDDPGSSAAYNGVT